MRDRDFSQQPKCPTGIVVHSGAQKERVAESSIEDGRDVSYHLAWSEKHGRIVQLVALNFRAWHAGSAGNDWIGIALPGPYDLNPRPAPQVVEFRLAVRDVLDALAPFGKVRYWCRHSDIDPDKHDPGPGFDGTWFEGLGLEWKRGPKG